MIFGDAELAGQVLIQERSAQTHMQSGTGVFDANRPVAIRLRGPDGVKTVRVLFPSDDEWAERQRRRKVIVKQLGRGISETMIPAALGWAKQFREKGIRKAKDPTERPRRSTRERTPVRRIKREPCLPLNHSAFSIGRRFSMEAARSLRLALGVFLIIGVVHGATVTSSLTGTFPIVSNAGQTINPAFGIQIDVSGTPNGSNPITWMNTCLGIPAQVLISGAERPR